MQTEEKQGQEQLPPLSEVIEKLMSPGTVLTYPELEIAFGQSRQAAVKSLKVRVFSTESRDMAVLHKLHTQTREII